MSSCSGKKREAAQILFERETIRSLTGRKGGYHENTVIRPFYVREAAAFCGVPHFNDDLHLVLQHRGWVFCVKLCRKDAVCSIELGISSVHGIWHSGDYDRDRRQRGSV